MKDIFDVINNRRSVREYKKEQLKDEEIRRILNAGIMAPTARFNEPWYFTVIQNKNLLSEINKKSHEILKNSNDEFLEAIGRSDRNILHNAPTVIVVSAKKGAANMQADISAAIENILLAAEGLNIGTCWLGLIQAFFQDEENIAKLNIPEGYIPLYGVSLGYKVYDTIEPPKRNKNVFNWIK